MSEFSTPLRSTADRFSAPHQAMPGTGMAFFGRETRYVAKIYLQRTFIFAFVALAVILSLDVATIPSAVMSDRLEVHGLRGFPRLAYYMFLRATYVLPSILPISVIMGIVWTEFVLAGGNERVMIFNSGRPPVYSLIPALLVGILIGIFQYGALAYGRPISVELHGLSKIRYYGPKMRRPHTTDRKWIATDNTVVYARVEFKTDFRLLEVVVYKISEQGTLETIISAASAEPTDTLGVWNFNSGTEWHFSPAADGLLRQEDRTETNFKNLQIEMSLHPVWVENIDVDPPKLRQRDLKILASNAPGIPKGFSYQTAYQERFASFFTTIGISLLAASLCFVMLTSGANVSASLKIGLYGYCVHVSSVLFILLGQYGYLPAIVAVWTLPILFIFVSAIILYIHHAKGRSPDEG